MQTLISAAVQFPTAVFTFLLALIVLYWLLVLVRVAPLELFERDSLRDDHTASTLVSLGFAGVPATLALSILVLLAGAISLAVELLVLRWLPLGMLRVPVGVLVLWGSLAVASPIAAAICHALQRGLHRYQPFKRRCLLGATVVVTEPQQDGCATSLLDDEPNSFIKLHCKAGDTPRLGERRVLVKYLAEEGAYRSVLEQQYLETRVWLSKLRLHHKQQQRSNGYSA
ncbi:hypothetical protein [Halomonas sp. GFAJ-1]|uniref:hypothetical protein n=1 Tax=Halomonas sp. GFAJ-1 TaxID=1118153 RepID=UPI00023A33F5|nr:hypothetical protein [Halomonas sp. GFAJ-1]AVI62719.1 hypothetical protein BB497_08365 [Halomonas sp. GFAJ-1]EHK59769.1 hypothetical protein MOY_14187 [Halomonas sp. GFAJ-1]